jgi:transposase
MEEKMQKILELTPEIARNAGIKHRSTLKRMKDRIVKNGKINLNTKAVRKFVNVI